MSEPDSVHAPVEASIEAPGLTQKYYFDSGSELPKDLDRCFHQAAQRYQVNSQLLIAIAKTESELLSTAINLNRGKRRSVDLGVMQINSYWWPILAEEYGIYPKDLLDPCININVGAWILAGSVAKYGEVWRAVGSYNAGTGRTKEVEEKRSDYVSKVYRHFVDISTDRLQQQR